MGVLGAETVWRVCSGLREAPRILLTWQTVRDDKLRALQFYHNDQVGKSVNDLGFLVMSCI